MAARAVVERHQEVLLGHESWAEALVVMPRGVNASFTSAVGVRPIRDFPMGLVHTADHTRYKVMP